MTERKGETKRQHYVPRMILRKFSADGKRISLALSDGRRLDRVSLKEQCYVDYFYGADNIMEKSFAAQEDEMARFLGDLTPARFATLSTERIHQLRLFVHYQHSRTLAAATHYNNFVGAFTKSVLKDSILLNKHPTLRPEDLDLVEIKTESAQNETIWQAAKSIPLLLDLGVKFIMTDRTPGFIVADNPVVAYNQFAQTHPVLKHCPVSASLALKGFQLFLPLSPSMIVTLYDATTYEYGGRSFVCKAGPNDVAYLNQMQAVNALSCFYFHEDRMDDVTFATLVAQRRQHPSVYEKTHMEGPMIPHESGVMSRMVLVHNTEIRIGAKLSFVRTLDGHSYDGHDKPFPPIRSPELQAISEDFGRILEEKVAADRAEREQQRTG